MWPFHATALVAAATMGKVTKLLRNFRSERPEWAETVPNRGLWNGAVIAAVEAVTVKRGDDPYCPRFDSVGAIGPRVKGTLQVVAESSCAVGKQLSIDSNSICAHLDLVARKRDDWLKKRRPSVGAGTRCAILATEGD
jgi:hypothetical protein